MGYASTLYSIKRGFLILGFTGYTASGCTTAVDYIGKVTKPSLPRKINSVDINEIGKFKNLQREWDDFEWNNFINIEVALVIMMFAFDQCLKYNYSNENLKFIKEIVGDHKNDLRGLKFLHRPSSDLKNPRNAKELVLAYQTTKKLSDKIKSALSRGYIYNYIKILQKYGDDIRKYGKIEVKKGISDPSNILILPEAVRKIIKAYRICEKKNQFTIDAFRNPFEVEFFKRRYSEFYLVCITRTEEDRKSQLYKNKLNCDQIMELSNTERCKNKDKKEIFEWITSQNIPECAQKASYYINSVSVNHLKLEIARLLCLIKHPGCFQPTYDEFHMEIAMTARQKSGCISRKVGAVVVGSDNSIMGIGWNQPPSGQEACINRTTYELIESENSTRFSDYELSESFKEHIKKKYCENDLDVPFCFKDELYSLENNTTSHASKKNEFTRSLHAEERAFLSIKEHSHHLKNCTLFTTDSPCTLCAKKAYHVGVNRIVFIEEYPGITNIQTLKSGIRKNEIVIEQFEGAAGEAYDKLFSSIMPEKDYLKILIHEKKVNL